MILNIFSTKHSYIIIDTIDSKSITLKIISKLHQKIKKGLKYNIKVTDVQNVVLVQ